MASNLFTISSPFNNNIISANIDYLATIQHTLGICLSDSQLLENITWNLWNKMFNLSLFKLLTLLYQKKFWKLSKPWRGVQHDIQVNFDKKNSTKNFRNTIFDSNCTYSNNNNIQLKYIQKHTHLTFFIFKKMKSLFLKILHSSRLFFCCLHRLHKCRWKIK